MKVTELMTATPCCCSANDTVEEVARIMRDNDCGSVPVTDDAGRLAGIVTDRDLTVRGFAEGKSGNTRVGDIMTPSPYTCSVDDDIGTVEMIMADNQVRRVPIIDSVGRCVGIIAQADLANAAERSKVSEHEVAVVVERISEPANPPVRTHIGDRDLEKRL